MATIHPAAEERTKGFRPSGAALEDLVNSLILGIKKDEDSTNTWLHRQMHYYQRRYCRIDRNTSWPWPGASDVVMPTIDMTIDRLKAVFSRLVFTNPLMVRFESFRADQHQQARTDEVFFDWLLKFGIPDFRHQITIAIDFLLQYGLATTKTYWHYHTQKADRVFNISDVPLRYEEFLRTANVLGAATLATQDRDAFVQSAARDVADRVQDQTLAALGPIIASDYGIDTDEKEGKKALETILRAIKNRSNNVPYTIKEVLHNAPRVIALNPQDFILGGNHHDSESAPRATHRLWLTESSFRARAVEQRWAESAVNRVLDDVARTPKGQSGIDRFVEARSVLKQDMFESVQSVREGVDSFVQSVTELIELHEVHFFLDVDNDGVDEKVVALVHPGSGTLMKDIEKEPYEHGMRPFDRLSFELNDHRYYSPRGVPEKIDDIDWEITLRHRNKLNNMDMMVPTFKYRSTSQVDPEQIHFIPGEFYPVTRQDDIEVMPVPDRTFNDDREEQILLTWNERYLGGFDALSSQGAISEARTATEINALRQAGAETLAFRGQVLQNSLRSVYRKAWALWNQWGSPEVYEQIVGVPMVRKTPAEIRRSYDVVPVGTIESSDPVLETQKSFARLQALIQIVQANGGSVVSGTHKIELPAAIQRWLEMDDVTAARTVFRELTQQEIQEATQQQGQQAVQDELVNRASMLEAVNRLESGSANGNGRQREET